MAFYSDQWSIDYNNKTITNLDSPLGLGLPCNKGTDACVGTVLSFFQWCASVFANSAQMDDDYAFVSDTPTVYRFVNGWGFGSVSDYKYLSGGSIETYDASTLYSNLYSIGTQEEGTLLYMIQQDAEVTPWWKTGNIDILVKVKEGGQWIQSVDTAGASTNGAIWIYAREFGNTYDHNFSNLSGGGRNPIGINTAADSGNRSGETYLTLNTVSGFTVGQFVKDMSNGTVGKIAKIDGTDLYVNAARGGTGTFSEEATLAEYSERECLTASGTDASITAVVNVVKGYTDISTGFGDIQRDLNNGNGMQPYKVEVDAAGRTMTEVYEWLKYITRYGSKSSTYTLNGDDGQEYRSALEGTYSEVKVAPFGTLAGTTFYGARGVWIADAATAAFVLIDANNAEQNPPNYQKVTATNTLLNGCRILVTEITGDGGTIIKGQYAIESSTADIIYLNAAVNTNKTPQSGSLRVSDTIYTYTSFDSSAILGVSPAPSVAEDASLYIPLLDATATSTTKQSDNIIYSSAFWVRTNVRKYGYKPYTADTQFGATGLSFSPILTSDPQAT